MRISEELASSLKNGFSQAVCRAQGLALEPGAPGWERWARRALAPHARALSAYYNRLNSRNPWASSAKDNVLSAYSLYFAPQNAFRAAATWQELARLGLKVSPSNKGFRALELGAGTGAATLGISLAEDLLPVGIGNDAKWSWVDAMQAPLRLGSDVFRDFSKHPTWSVKGFQRKLVAERPWLPRSAGRFDLIVLSFFLNEVTTDTPVTDRLRELMEFHLEREGLLIILEPALQKTSRSLLELRKELLTKATKKQGAQFQVLTPCLGHQLCGALEDPTDWCHEEALWWRPEVVRFLDDELALDHKSLRWSYLVLCKSSRQRNELLARLPNPSYYRLVSPTHRQGKDSEFWVCGPEKKNVVRIRSEKAELMRGDVLHGVKWENNERSYRRIVPTSLGLVS